MKLLKKHQPQKSHQTTREKEQSHGNAYQKKPDNSSSGEQLVEQHPIKNTPFTALKYDGKWYLTMGKYRLTKELQTKEKCIYESKNASWNRLMQVIQIMIDNNTETKQPQQNKPEIKTE